MQADSTNLRKVLSEDLMSVLIRFGLIAFILFLSVRIFAPFALLVLWALVLAVMLYPLQCYLAARLGGRQGRAATVIVVVGLLLVGVPTVMLGISFAEHLHGLYLQFQAGTLKIPQPAASVADWPVIGVKVYELWQLAANDLPAVLADMRPQLERFFGWLLQTAAGTAGSILASLGSLIIAGIMMAYGQAGSSAMLRIFERLAGKPKGEKLHKLSTATVRSVATGVVGVAVGMGQS